jgi:hypothetical protein
VEEEKREERRRKWKKCERETCYLSGLATLVNRKTAGA